MLLNFALFVSFFKKNARAYGNEADREFRHTGESRYPGAVVVS
jgi:hypothetical protein